MAKSALLVPVSRTYGPGIVAATSDALGDPSGSVAKHQPVKDGVFMMLKTADQNAARPTAPPIANTATVAASNPLPITTPAKAVASKVDPTTVVAQKASPKPVDSNYTSAEKKPNMLEPMTSKIEDVSSPPVASAEKKKNMFGKLFGKSNNDGAETSKKTFFGR